MYRAHVLRRASARAFAGLLVGLALSTVLAAGCTRRATQLMLVIDSNLDTSTYQCVSVEVARVSDGTAVTPTQYVSFNVPTQVRVPFSLGLLPPNGDASVRVEIRAEARVSCVDPNTTPVVSPAVVRSVTRAGFASEQTLRLPMFLAAICTGVTCAEGSSCDPDTGECAAILEQRPEDLTPTRPGEEIPDAGTSEASPDAGTDAGPADQVCPLQGNDYTDLASAAPRAFGLTITEPGREWVVLYDDGGALHAIRIPYDMGQESAAPAWTLSPGADAIAIEGMATGDALIALVNPTGSTDLVRYVGALAGPAPAMTPVGTGRLVQRGRHSARFGSRIATVVERGAGVAVVAVGATDSLVDLFVSSSAVEIALGNTAAGDLIVAIGGASCELRTFDAAGATIATSSLAPSGVACAPRGVSKLVDGRFAVVYGTTSGALPQIRLSLFTTPADMMSRRLNMTDDYASPIAAVLGHDDTFRVGWTDLYDYPDVAGSTPLQPGVLYWTGFTGGTEVSEYSDHGDATTDHELTRWERRGLRTALVMPGGTGFRFRSICRPTPP